MLSNVSNIVGMRVYNKKTRSYGKILGFTDDGKNINVDVHGRIEKHPYPSCFSNILELEDEDLQESLHIQGNKQDFNQQLHLYNCAVYKEIAYIKKSGGKKYRITDGKRLDSDRSGYMYAFDTDTEMFFPDSTPIKLWFPDEIVNAVVLSCEDYTIIIKTYENFGESITSVDFTADSWQLLEALTNRIEELNYSDNPISQALACDGYSQIDEYDSIVLGQDEAIKRALSEEITFIWGPPGTGKTYSLAKIAIESICRGDRVLMLSYSNVSVDGAILRVADMYDDYQFNIVRYGYPRNTKLIDDYEMSMLNSYKIVLHQNPELEKQYDELQHQKKKTRKKSVERTEINEEISKIRQQLQQKEHELVSKAAFVATTVSKAIIDPAIYNQKFDVVIFDEASMAYVPQIIFAASLTKKSFVCLGDFKQLPAIVQDNDNTALKRDIFNYTGISSAVSRGVGHKWLVMLNTQYRMHPDIASFVSKEQYNGLLQSPADEGKLYRNRQEIADLAPVEKSPICMFDLSGMYSVCFKAMDGSHVNILSAMISVYISSAYAGIYDVGIITPYNAQARLITSMIRDLKEIDRKYEGITCATVHQFQGSEKPIILFDVVDCYRMPYIGTLLTSLENDTADRLFNVALTRAQGKFVCICNEDFLHKKKLSTKLMISRCLHLIDRDCAKVDGHIVSSFSVYDHMCVGDIAETWERYLGDLEQCEKSIFITVPGMMAEDDEAYSKFADILRKAKKNGIKIEIYHEEDTFLPYDIEEYSEVKRFVVCPVTIIDNKVVWYGQPLCVADFISQDEPIPTDYYFSMRFCGEYFAKQVKALLDI